VAPNSGEFRSCARSGWCTPTLITFRTGFSFHRYGTRVRATHQGGQGGGMRQGDSSFDLTGGMSAVLACAVKRRRFPVGASPTRQPLQPEAIGAVMEVTKWLKPSISVSRIGDSASVQAATRVNAEQSSKRTMRRPTRQPFRGRLIRLDEMSEAIRPDAAPG
jgi:hypothetical protein